MQFVDTTISSLISLGAQLAPLVEELRSKVYLSKKNKVNNDLNRSSSRGASPSGDSSSRTGQLQTTQPQPFNLSQPRPKPVPVEEVVPPRPVAKPPPPRRSGPTREELELEQKRAENRAALEAKYADPK
jgi:hypothetical protein